MLVAVPLGPTAGTIVLLRTLVSRVEQFESIYLFQVRSVRVRQATATYMCGLLGHCWQAMPHTTLDILFVPGTGGRCVLGGTG